MLSNKRLLDIIDVVITICYNECHHSGQTIEEYAQSVLKTLKETKKKGK